MNICIHRIEQRKIHEQRHYCRTEKRRCSGLQQAGCVAADIWPIWILVGLIAAMLLMAIIFQ